MPDPAAPHPPGHPARAGAAGPGSERELLVFYGGTFDPVHCGHLAVAAHVHAALSAPVRLMPSADPPHRAQAPGADARHRAAMVSLAVAGRRGLVVDLRELERGEPSRTIDTLRAVRAECGDARPVAFVLGTDSFLGLPGWKGWPGLLDLAHWIVADRGGHALDAGLPDALAGETRHRWTTDPAALRAGPGGRLLRLAQPLHPASASRVRALVAADGPWRALVPEAVARYIDRHRLYMAPGAASPSL